jgi:hypothetical protein
MLDDGFPYRAILQALAAAPNTNPSIQQSSNPAPISPMNLSNWFHGGYQDWRRSNLNSAPCPHHSTAPALQHSVPPPERANPHLTAPNRRY